MIRFDYDEFKLELARSIEEICEGEEHCDAFHLLEDNIEYCRLHSIFWKINQGLKLSEDDTKYLKNQEIVYLENKAVVDYKKGTTNQPRLNLKRTDLEVIKPLTPYTIFFIPQKVQNDLSEYEDMRKFTYGKDNNTLSLKDAFMNFTENDLKRFLIFAILEFENNNNRKLPNRDFNTKSITELLGDLEELQDSIGGLNYLFFRFIEDAIKSRLENLIQDNGKSKE